MKLSVIHASIKRFLLTKGFISESEALADGFLSTTEAAYASFCVNRLGLLYSGIPHNTDSFPKAILEDEDFVIVQDLENEESDTDNKVTENSEGEINTLGTVSETVPPGDDNILIPDLPAENLAEKDKVIIDAKEPETVETKVINPETAGELKADPLVPAKVEDTPLVKDEKTKVSTNPFIKKK